MTIAFRKSKAQKQTTFQRKKGKIGHALLFCYNAEKSCRVPGLFPGVLHRFSLVSSVRVLSLCMSMIQLNATFEVQNKHFTTDNKSQLTKKALQNIEQRFKDQLIKKENKTCFCLSISFHKGFCVLHVSCFLFIKTLYDIFNVSQFYMTQALCSSYVSPLLYPCCILSSAS